MTCVIAFLAVHSAIAQSITVGPNINVSADRPQDSFWEVMVCANPEKADELFAVATLNGIFKLAPRPHHEFSPSTLVYRSADAGRSWKSVLVSAPHVADPTCAFGLNGTIFVAGGQAPGFSGVSSSHDGGATWTQAAVPSAEPPNHGPFLSVDRSPGTYQGRVYLTTFAKGEDTFTVSPVLWSADGGKTFAATNVTHRLGEYFGNNVVLPDGTFVFLESIDRDSGSSYRAAPPARTAHRRLELQLFRSSDGGRTFAAPVTIANIQTDDREQQMVIPAFLAVDSGSAAFKGRLYTVWKDDHSGREQILVSSSSDSGETWTAPVLVDHDVQKTFSAGFTGNGPNNFMPQIAVNADGIVGVTWYDRREAADNIGYRVRFSSSLDGGETWLPSVAVSTRPNQMDRPDGLNRATVVKDDGGSGRFFIFNLGSKRNAGDYSGLAADATGHFHAVWNDNRTGVPQIWTATITVGGQSRNPVAGRPDLTRQVTLTFANTEYDRHSRTVTTDVTIKNTGNTPLGPLVLRISGLRSVLARVVTVMDLVSRQEGGSVLLRVPGSQPGDRLLPGESAIVPNLTFRVANLLPLTAPEVEDPNWHGVSPRLVEFDARVYGGSDH